MHDAVLCCDLDGVVWLGETPIRGSADAIARLRSSGRRVVFVTNNSSATRGEYAAKLTRLGIPSGPSDVISSASAAGSWCVATLGREARVLVCAGAGVHEALHAAGCEQVVDASQAAPGDVSDAVVCGWHRHFDFQRLAVAADAVHRGARFVATNLDPTYPTAHGRLPGNGALVAAIATASGRSPDVVAGKPHEPMVAAVRAVCGDTGIMVGDRPSTDGVFATRLGWPFALVLSGVAGEGGEEPVPEPAPDYVTPDLASFVERLL